MTGNDIKNKFKDLLLLLKRAAPAVWRYLKVAKMEWIIIVSVFAVDLISKALVENFLDGGVSVTLIPYFLNARKTHNVGAVFGSGWFNDLLGGVGARIFLCVFAVAASVTFSLILIKHKGKSRVFRISLALFISGAMGNCIDRMFLAYVRDFIEFVFYDFSAGEWTTWRYIFNIADVALVSGVILIVFYFLFLYKENDSKKLGRESMEGVDGMTAEAAETVDSAENAETVDSAENAETVDSAENAEAVETAETVDNAEAVETAENAEQKTDEGGQG